jgi:hypothetical protein
MKVSECLVISSLSIGLRRICVASLGFYKWEQQLNKCFALCIKHQLDAQIIFYSYNVPFLYMFRIIVRYTYRNVTVYE